MKMHSNAVLGRLLLGALKSADSIMMSLQPFPIPMVAVYFDMVEIRNEPGGTHGGQIFSTFKGKSVPVRFFRLLFHWRFF